MKITLATLAAIQPPAKIEYEIKPPELIPGVAPSKPAIAMDYALPTYEYAQTAYYGMGFPGYPRLATLLIHSEYRAPTETTAKEMVRKWIKLSNSDRIKRIEQELVRHKVRDLFKLAAEHDGFFGRAQIYVDLGVSHQEDEKPLSITSAKIKKGSLRGFRCIEPMWTTPVNYNSTDPTAPDFYVPQQWYVMGRTIHSSRLLMMVSRPMPDMLKPAYNFSGMSMTQLMEPYVESWLRNRQSVSDLLHAFSISILSTDMESALSPEDPNESLERRIELFNRTRDNRGLMVLNKDTEELNQINTPLSGLDHLLAQSQEQMAAPSHTPLVKLLGVTPSGLNASSKDEIAVYYDHTHSMQEAIFREPLEKIIRMIQLDVWGDIDESVTFKFEPLLQLSELDLSTVRLNDTQRDVANVSAGIISNDEVRERLTNDPDSKYENLTANSAE